MSALTYASFIQTFPHADYRVLHCPLIHVGMYERVTLFRTYDAVEQYLIGVDVLPNQMTMVPTVRAGRYPMRDVGNQGFKRSYLRVFDTVQVHPEHGPYVAWMVHK